MQIYAYDKKGEEVAAHSAKRGTPYYCPDCHQTLSFRSSPLIRPHFFHLKDQRPCFHTQKTLTHLEIQAQLLALLPPGEAKMEHRFKGISRIADVFWEKERLVFEAQVSFITAEEVEARSKAYRSVGCEIVWILHHHRYAKERVTAAERYLQDHTHYFSNHTPAGSGLFYDQYSYHLYGKRLANLFRRPVNLAHPVRHSLSLHLPPTPQKQRQNWKLSFAGDILNSLNFREWDLKRARQIESLLMPEKKAFTMLKRVQKRVTRFLKLVGYILLDSL